MSLRLVPKSVTLSDFYGDIALILHYFFPNLVVYSAGAHCVKVVDKAITTDNFCTITMSSSKRLQRDRARPTV